LGPGHQSGLEGAISWAQERGNLMTELDDLSRRAWLAGVAGMGIEVASARSLEAARPDAAVVGVARGSTMVAATRAAVRLAGGLAFLQRGPTVLVKPNGCCP